MTEDVKIAYDDIVRQTKKAVLYQIDDDEYWIPLSQIKEIDLISQWFVLPYWLVEKKGLEKYIW